MRTRVAVIVAMLLVVPVACTGDDPVDAQQPTPSSSSLEKEAPTGAPTPPQSSPSVQATVTPRRDPPKFDAQRAFNVVERLAGEIGPREGSSNAYREAAAFVQRRFERLGYDVTRQRVPVPAGVSWGVEVPEGRSRNVIADPPGFDPTERHVVIGAHLDTVPQAPGAEDNASGIGVLLELARMASVDAPSVPVRFVAFGAEEPRGDGDSMHHFGSQLYVRELPDAERDSLAAMVALDRVGVRAGEVPVCFGGQGSQKVRRQLVDAAGRLDIDVDACENRASDHWSFEKADIPAARLGSVPYAAYHSADDVPDVVSVKQLNRVGRITWAWLTAR